MPDSNRLLQAYVNSVDVGICMLCPQGKVREVNQTMTAIFGFSEEEVLEKHYESFLPLTEKAAARIRAMVEGETNVMPETELRWKHTSEIIYLLANAQDLQTEEYGTCRVLFFREVTEEVALRKELQYQASILSSVEDSIVVTNVEGKISYWNKAAERLFGHKASEMLGKDITYFDPEFNIKAFLEDPEHWTLFYQDLEWAYKRPDGKQVWTSAKVSPLLNKENEIDGFIGVSKNITEKRKRDQDLHRKQKELSNILESQTNYLIRTDLQARFTYVNKAFEQKFSHYGDIIGKNSMETIIPEDHEKTYQMVEECLTYPGKMVPIEIRKPAPDGGYVTNYWEFVAITDEQGNPTEIQGVGYDISEKKKREQEIFRKQQELANIIDSQTSYLIRTDLQARFIYVNKAFEQKFSHYGNIIGKNSMETIIPEDHEKTYQMVEECLTYPGKMIPIEIRKPAPDGGYYTNYWEFVAITDEQGNPTEIQGVGYDISDRKKSEQKIISLNEFNRLLLDISTRFINLSYSELDERINEAMAAVTEFTGFERSFIYLFNEEMTLGYLTYEYCMPGVSPSGPENRVFPAEPFPWWMGRVLSGQTVEVRDLDSLPPEAANEKQVLFSAGIKSVVVVPIIYQDDFLGYVGFSSISDHKSWNGESSSLLKLLGAIFANAVYRSRTDKALVESRNDYKLLADNITDMISRHDDRTRFTYLSPSCRELLGYSPKRLLGHAIADLVHPHDREQVRLALEEAAEQGSTQFVARFRRENGNYIWVESQGRMITQAGKSEFVTTTRNIHQQRLAEIEKDQLLQETQALNEQLGANEEELRQNLETTVELNDMLSRSERKFKGLLEKSFDAIVVYDAEGLVTYASPSAYLITGYDTMEGLHGIGFVVEEDREEAIRIAQEVMTSPGDHFTFEQRLRRKDGRIIQIEAVMTNLLDDPAINGLVSNFRDITERKQAEQKIRDNETSLKIAQKVAKVGSWEANLANGETKWSEEFYNIMGFRPEKHTPDRTDFNAFVHPEDAEQVRKCTEEVFSHYKNMQLTYRVYDTSGKLKYIDAQTIVLFDENGQPENVFGTIQDVTRETELERLLDETSQIAKVGGWEVDLEMQKVIWTTETYRIHELPTDEEVDMDKALSFYEPNHQKILKNALDCLISNKELYDLELQITTASGKRKWVRTTGGGYDEKEGKVTVIRGAIQDISDKKEQAEELTKYSERLMLAVQTARIGIWELDVASGQLSWNEQQHKIYGISPKQFAKDVDYWKSLVHPDDVGRADAEMAKAMEGQAVFNIEFRIIRPDGQLRYLDASARPIRDQEGRVIKLIGVNLDVTSIRQHEEEIRNYSERLALATESAQIGVWDLDMVSGRLHWDQQTKQLYGVDESSFKDTFEDWRKHVHADDIDLVTQKFEEAVKTKDDYEAEFKIIRSDNQQLRHLIAYARIIRDKDGDPLRMVGVSWDVTKGRQNEERLLQNNDELRKANSELDHFVYSTSHNLRAPLTSIMGIVEVMREVKNPVELLKFMNLIEKSIHKLDETIQEISAYSKNNRLEVKAEPINFEGLINDIADSLSFMENADKLKLNIIIPDNLQFYSDTSRLKIIFNNLLSNAIKYYNPHQDKPEVSIEIETQQGGIKLLVRDNGIGISQQYLDRIFDMFFRATNKASGSGLGLYIVKEAVEKLGGSISISSELSVGTTFAIYLPDLEKKAIKKEP